MLFDKLAPCFTLAKLECVLPYTPYYFQTSYSSVFFRDHYDAKVLILFLLIAAIRTLTLW